jgi:hypothetical protein
VAGQEENLFLSYSCGLFAEFRRSAVQELKVRLTEIGNLTTFAEFLGGAE